MKSKIASMTGFARSEGAQDGWRFVWEIRSVNGRGLEWRCRLPQGFEALEPELRKRTKKKLARGSVNCTLTLNADATAAGYRVNEDMLAEAVAMVEKLRVQIECAPPQPEGILALRGVIEAVDGDIDDEARSHLIDALIKGYEEALDGLVASRQKEGEAMHAVLKSEFDEIEKLTKDAADHAAVTPKAIRQRIEAQLQELLGDSGINEERLAQEAALLAIKADVREELDRLKSHVESGRALLAKTGAVGRDLDFLIQECNREANTLCSKAADMDLKRIGLDLKKVIDQLREQVQNIE
ncbi:YicC/YloC family endoribonuclease [Hyphococcus sp. DH-69]|uniref:YicC/YloC family endoribonuclease n=1 Tax=Hyphococcus formosus TaxID=3143534 RepID=UPI00398A7A5A